MFYENEIMDKYAVNLILIAAIVFNVFMLVGCAQNREKSEQAQPTSFSESTPESNEPDSLSQ